MRGPVSKVCESCHEVFICGQYGCWCAQREITDQQMQWIEQTFQDCLCPLCLQKVISGEIAPIGHDKPQ